MAPPCPATRLPPQPGPSPRRPAADPQVDAPVRDRKRPNRQRQLEIAVSAHPPDGAHRGTPADRLELGDQIDRGILGAPVTDPPGNVAARSSPTRHHHEECLPRSRRDAAPLREAARPSTRPADAARLADAREIVVFQIDDHDALGPSFSDPARSSVESRGRVPLIGIVHTRRPRRARNNSGDADTIVQPSPAKGTRSSLTNGARRRGDRGRVAAERGG